MKDEAQPASKRAEPTAVRTKIARLAKVVVPLLYGLFCAIVILIFSGEDYEWMVGQHEADGSVVTLCTIPASIDSTSDMSIPALLMIALLFAPGLMRFIEKRRVDLSLFLSLGLFALWAYRFFVRTAFC